MGATAGQLELDHIRRWLVEELPLRRWPGAVVDANPERVVEFRPSWPVAGPNGVRVLRCSSARLAAVVEEVREMARRQGVGMVWMLDEESHRHEAALRELGMTGDTVTTELALASEPAAAELPPDTSFRDGLSSLAAFRDHLLAVEGGFRNDDSGGEPPGQLERRYQEHLERPGFHLVTALVAGVPAGGGEVAVWPDAARLGGGALLPRFRGRGVYWALVSERIRRARAAGAALITTNARPDTSGPILRRLGFVPVSSRWVLLDPVVP